MYPSSMIALPTDAGHQDWPHDSPDLSRVQVQALVRAIEGAPDVKRRYQFFVWMQNHLHVLLPHELAVCGSFQRQRRDLVFEAFHSVALPAGMLSNLTGVAPQAMALLARAWTDQECRALVLCTRRPASPALAALCNSLAAGGLGHAVMHGVSRPQRPAELESLFLLAGTADEPSPGLARRFELLLPHLHATYLRMQDTEHGLGTAKPLVQELPAKGLLLQITLREREILRWVREGKSNLQIGEQLGISGLTVKNHVQKILRKLGASNRAQAVALAMSAQLLELGDGGAAPPQSRG